MFISLKMIISRAFRTSFPASNALKSNMAANAEFQDLAASSGETENISDLVASRSTSNTSLLNGPRNLAYASVERANLLNLSKLCIKNLIESSLKLGRSLGEDHKPLQQFFVIIEHVLRHGLRGKCRL